MKFQEAAAALDYLEAEFGSATRALAEIVRELGIVRPGELPHDAPQAVMHAAQAAITSPMGELLLQAANPALLPLAVQLSKDDGKIRLGLPGGGMLTDQERAWIEKPGNTGGPAPSNLFYQIAQEQLLSEGALRFSYSSELASATFQESLRGDLLREICEELGEEAASRITLGPLLDGEQRTNVAFMRLPSAQASRAIAESLSARGVSLDAAGRLRGIYTTIVERVAVAHGPLEEVALLSQDNEEAQGIEVKTLGEMREIAAKTSGSADSFLNFRKRFPRSGGHDGIRSPSTTWALKLFAGWLRELVVKADPYREGARSAPPQAESEPRADS